MLRARRARKLKKDAQCVSKRQTNNQISLTARISFTTKHIPPPFFPLKAAMAPGKIGSDPDPPGIPRSFRFGSNRKGIRYEPEPIEREDSKKVDSVVSFDVDETADASASLHIRPTTTMSFYVRCKSVTHLQ